MKSNRKEVSRTILLVIPIIVLITGLISVNWMSLAIKNASVSNAITQRSLDSSVLAFHYIEGNLNITIDGILNESVWYHIPGCDKIWPDMPDRGSTPVGKLILVPEESNSNQGSSKTIELLIRGLYNSTHFAIVCQWNDSTANTIKDRWVYNNSQWTNENQEEDTLGIIININTTIQSPMIPPPDYHNGTGRRADFWWWHAALTDPLGYADDLVIIEDVVGDSGLSSGFTENSYYAQTNNTGIFNDSDVPYWNNNSEVIDYVSENFSDGDTLPGYRLFLPGQDRRDVIAKGLYNISKKEWVVEMIRLRGTLKQSELIGIPPNYEYEIYDNYPDKNDFTVFVEDGTTGLRYWKDPTTSNVTSFELRVPPWATTQQSFGVDPLESSNISSSTNNGTKSVVGDQMLVVEILMTFFAISVSVNRFKRKK